MAKSRLFTKRKPPSGSVPGTLSIDESSPFPIMKLITFNEKEIEEVTVEDPSLLEEHIFEKGRVNWIDVQGLGDEKTVRKLG
ncbi:MAG TPA: magnesium and cobalt transport protein CorA, partial [Mesotoga sp.]|nr:magnesium and cobalt transport protein CorA [Mesotoga sp.]